MIDYRDLALRANQSLIDNKPLVLESEAEKVAIRSYAEFNSAWHQNRVSFEAWLREYGDVAVRS